MRSPWYSPRDSLTTYRQHNYLVIKSIELWAPCNLKIIRRANRYFTCTAWTIDVRTTSYSSTMRMKCLTIFLKIKTYWTGALSGTSIITTLKLWPSTRRETSLRRWVSLVASTRSCISLSVSSQSNTVSLYSLWLPSCNCTRCRRRPSVRSTIHRRIYLRALSDQVPSLSQNKKRRIIWRSSWIAAICASSWHDLFVRHGAVGVIKVRTLRCIRESIGLSKSMWTVRSCSKKSWILFKY